MSVIFVTLGILFFLNACKADDIYDEREEEILEAIELELKAFGIADASEFKITNKGSAGEAFNPHSLTYTFQYTGENGVPFTSQVRIDYDDAEEGTIESGNIYDDYATAYFDEKAPNGEEIRNIFLNYFSGEEITSVSILEYVRFTDAAEISGISNYNEIERMIDNWFEITQHIAPIYALNIEIESLSEKEHETIITELKDELHIVPIGEYRVTIQINEHWEEWNTEIYVTK